MKKFIGINVEQSLFDKIEQDSKKNMRSKSAQIALILQNYYYDGRNKEN